MTDLRFDSYILPIPPLIFEGKNSLKSPMRPLAFQIQTEQHIGSLK